jgi:hypothetical protein
MAEIIEKECGTESIPDGLNLSFIWYTKHSERTGEYKKTI